VLQSVMFTLSTRAELPSRWPTRWSAAFRASSHQTGWVLKAEAERRYGFNQNMAM